MIIILFLLLLSQKIYCQEIVEPAQAPEPTVQPEITVPEETQKATETQEHAEPDVSQEAKPEEPEIEPGKLELLDKIEAEIITSTPETTDAQIITMSDVRKRKFDGGKYTIEDLVNEALADNLGKVFKINLTDDDVNKYLKRANLTDKKKLKELTEQWGYESLEEFYENFKKIYRANSALQYEMSSQLVVLEDEIQEYHEQNPVYKEANYTIETTFVLLDSTKTKEELRKELEEYVQGKRDLDYIIWDAPITVKKSEATSLSQFLDELKPGEIYIKELNDGFDLFKLIKKEPETFVSLEERKREIINILQEKKHAEAYNKVHDDLTSKAIIYKPDQEVPENVSELINEE